MIDTGKTTMTGGRLKRLSKYLIKETFFMTYGDGLSNVNLKKLLKFHKNKKKLVTLTAVRPPARFGNLKIKGTQVKYFKEKSNTDEGWINGGFFVLEPQVTDYVESLDEPFESGALVRLVDESNLMAYHHESFWQPMDTLREKRELERDALLEIPPWLNFKT